MFSKSLEAAVTSCYKEAREKRLASMGTEQLVFWLLHDQEVALAVEACGADLQPLRDDLRAYIDEHVERLEPDSGADTQPTIGFQRVLQRAVYHVQSSGKKEVSPLRCLIAAYGEKDSHAFGALKHFGVERLDLVNFISTGEVRLHETSPREKIERIKETPAVLTPVRSSNSPRLRVFISYSHADRSCLDRLLVHLKPFHREGKIDAWSDTRIRPGSKWKQEIAENIERAAVAVLLLSADFLASDFIVEKELPPLLFNAESNGTRILPVVLKPCGFHRTDILSSFQCVNDPRLPLLGLAEIDQEHLYENIASEIHDELKKREG